jgi:uncharacterized protein YjiS (DUF1127 family)
MENPTLRLTNSDNNRSCGAPFRRSWKERLRRWHTNWKTRRLLAELDPHQLKDIGVSRGDALEEARKPFWVE